MKHPGPQRGATLLFALLALLVLAFGAVSLIRSVDTGMLAMGNLAFKQSGVASGARAVDTALAWLTANMGTATLDNNQPPQGYYATSMNALDPTGRSIGTGNLLAQVDWDSNGCVVNGQDVSATGCVQASPALTINGDQVRYVIARLCALPLSVDNLANSCEVPPIPASTESDDKGGGVGGRKPERYAAPPYNPYFRVITRSLGPKGTVSFTETLVHY